MKSLLFAATLMLVPAAAQDAKPQSVPDTVRASAEDCAVFAVLGKAKLGWSASAPPEGNYIAESMIARGKNENNMGLPQKYVAQCAWREIGLAEPVSDPKGGPKNYALGHPIYASPEQVHLTWNRFEFVKVNGRVDLHHRYQLCKLAKHDGMWQLEACEDEQDIIRDSHPEKQESAP